MVTQPISARVRPAHRLALTYITVGERHVPALSR
jgi:hypothetical protein